MTWLKNIFKADSNLIKKINIFVIVLIVSLLAMSSLSLFSVTEWKKSLERVYVENVQPSEKLTVIIQQADDIRFRLLGFLADRLPASGSKKKIIDGVQSIDVAWDDFFEQLQSEKLKPEEKEVIAKLKNGKVDFDKFVEKSLEELGKENKDKIGDMLDNEWPLVITNFLNPLSKFQEFQIKSIGETYSASTKIVQNFKLVIIGMIVSFLILAFYSIYFINQFKKQSNWAIDNLKKVEEALFQSSVSVKSASDSLTDITNSNRQSVEETSASLEEITNMVRITSEHAIQSSDFAENTSKVAERGEGVVGSMLKSIETINGTISNIIQEMQQMDTDLKTIESIFSEVENKTKVINDIVFQTRLLSFNASVESARAGEHGKGFAVVAEEVGNLAQMSGKAAAEISDLIVNGSKQVSSIVISGKENLAKLSVDAETSVNEGMQKATECNKSFQAISSSLSQIQSLIIELSKSTNEQTIGVSEVNKAMQLISQATEQSAMISSETQSISGQVEVEANNLKRTVDNLVKIFNG